MLDNRHADEPSRGAAALPPPAAGAEWFRRIAESAPDVVLVLNPDATLRYASPGVEEMLGWRPDELVGRGLSFVHPDDLESTIEALARNPAATEAARLEVRVRTRDGAWRHVEGLVTDLLDDPVVHGTVVHVRDVTDRVKAEQAADAAELRLRTLIEHMPAAVYVQSEDGDLATFYMSPQIERITGWSSTSYRDPAFWASHIHPDDRARAIELDERTDATGEPFSLEFRVVAEDGRIVWVHDEAVLVDTSDGRKMWQGIMMDITPRKEAEQALRTSHARFQTLVQRAPAGIFETDANGQCVWANERCAAMFGCAPSELLGFGWAEFIVEDDRQRVTESWRRAQEAGDEYDVEYRLVRSDGEIRWVSAASTPLQGDSGIVTGYLGTLVDVSESKLAEQVLQESVTELAGSLEMLRRTESERRTLIEGLVATQDSELGRMAEDIVDDPIQKLTAVGMRLETFRRGLSDPGQLGALDQLGETVTLATQRLRSLLFEMRPGRLDADGLAAAIREYLERTHLDDDPAWSVEDRFAQEVSPMIRSNAYRIVQEAIGNVRRHAQADHLWIVLEGLDGGLRVQIVDDGVGFALPVPSGPGRMGLAGMRERASLAGGHLELHSAPGTGTTLNLWLPNSTPE